MKKEEEEVLHEKAKEAVTLITPFFYLIILFQNSAIYSRSSDVLDRFCSNCLLEYKFA